MWNLLDKEIIGMCGKYLVIYWLTYSTDQARVTWWSNIYKHYNVSIVCHTSMDGGSGYIKFKFACKHNPAKHRLHTHRHMETSHGTKNLQRGQRECENRWGVTGDSNARAQQTLTNTSLPTHLLIIVPLLGCDVLSPTIHLILFMIHTTLMKWRCFIQELMSPHHW